MLALYKYRDKSHDLSNSAYTERAIVTLQMPKLLSIFLKPRHYIYMLVHIERALIQCVYTTWYLTLFFGVRF